MQPIHKDKCDFPTLRQPALVTRHSSFVTRHSPFCIVHHALCIAALAAFAASALADVVVLPEERRGRDFTMEFDARFAQGAPRNLTLRLGSASHPDVQPNKLSFSKTSIDFAGNWTRTLDFIGSGYTGTPFMEQRRFLLPFKVPDGEWRHVRVVSDGGYVTFFVQFGDKLQRTLTNVLRKDFFFAGYEFILPDGVEVANVKIGPFDEGDIPPPRAGYTVCRTPQTVDIPLKDGQASFAFIPGGYPVEVMLDFKDGTTNRLDAKFVSFCESFTHYLYNIERRDKAGVEEFERGGFGGNVRIPDYGMNFTSGRANFPIYTYPRLGGRYGAVQIIHMMTNLTAYGEQASEHAFNCSLVRRNGRNLLYVDGSYAATIGSTNPISALTLSLPIGGCWRLGEPPHTEGPDPRVVKIPDFEPFATKVCRVNLGSFALECNGYLSRGAFERQGESFLRRVPIGTYVRAKVRCRLAGDTNANTKVTARLTNFYSPNTAGRSPESVTQQTIELPRDLKGETNVVFQFDPGKIQDVIWQRGFEYLDFEVLGDSNSKHGYFDYELLMPVGTSDVVVVGAELELAPAGMCVRSGNAPLDPLYWPHEEAFVTAEVAALLAGRYRVAWEVTDIDGKVRENGAEGFDLAAGARETRRIVFKTRTPGWYGVAVRLQDAQGRTILRHDTSYVSLAEDTRKAGYDSPFFLWTGLGTHSKDRAAFERAMNHLHRLGVRKGQMGTFSEADAAQWGVTLSPLPFTGGFSTKSTEAERIAEYEARIRDFMTRFPHATAATIFHESGNCRSRNQPPDPAQDAEEIRKATELCQTWRRLAPQVKLVLGNGNLDKVAQILRNKFPRDLIDAMGEEATGGVSPSEIAVGEVFQEYRDLADQYGYTDLPVTPCYEWKSRPARNFDSRRLLAAYCVRDALIALAWGAEHVTLEGGYEADSSYFMSSWGAGAFSHRPYGYPYPTAAALATMTRALDQAKYSRVLPTGSETVYAIEYGRAGGGFVTALWTARGTVKAEIVASSRKVVKTGFYGEETRLGLSFGKRATIEICEEPVYLTTAEPLKGVTVLPGDRDFRFDRYPGIENVRMVAPLASLDEVSLDTNAYPRVKATNGAFTLRETDDQVRGKCLELVRDASNKGDAFGGVRFREPVVLEGKADTIGLWVKGNSSTGRVYFDIRDALGRRFYSTSQYHCYDWCGKMMLNYDGWRFISFPLTKASPVRIQTHVPDLANWYMVGPSSAWSPPVPPVSLLGIGFAWGDNAVHINERHPVGSNAVRISAFGVY